MSQLALGLKQKNLDQKLTLNASLVAGLTGNASFPNPDPPLTELEAKASAIEAKKKEIATAETKLTSLNSDLDQLDLEQDALLTAEARYIESTARGDATKMATSGAPLKGERAPVGPLPVPGNLRVTTGDREGEVDAMWDAVYGASTYRVRYSTTANGPWSDGYLGTVSRCAVTALTSGQEYFFQVSAIGAAGQGPWSDLARKRAS